MAGLDKQNASSSLGRAIKEKKETIFPCFHNKAYCFEVYKRSRLSELKCCAMQSKWRLIQSPLTPPPLKPSHSKNNNNSLSEHWQTIFKSIYSQCNDRCSGLYVENG